LSSTNYESEIFLVKIIEFSSTGEKILYEIGFSGKNGGEGKDLPGLLEKLMRF
jgi:hypothetical protein